MFGTAVVAAVLWSGDGCRGRGRHSSSAVQPGPRICGRSPPRAGQPERDYAGTSRRRCRGTYRRGRLWASDVLRGGFSQLIIQSSARRSDYSATCRCAQPERRQSPGCSYGGTPSWGRPGPGRRRDRRIESRSGTMTIKRTPLTPARILRHRGGAGRRNRQHPRASRLRRSTRNGMGHRPEHPRRQWPDLMGNARAEG